MSTTTSPRSAQLLGYVRNLLLPSFDELKFVMMLTAGLIISLTNSHLGHSVSVQLHNGKGFLLFVIVFFILLIIASKEKLPNDLKAWASVFYYGFFALIAHDAITRMHTQTYDNSLIAHLSSWFTYLLLVTAASRGIVTLLLVRDYRLNKLTARSLGDSPLQGVM